MSKIVEFQNYEYYGESMDLIADSLYKVSGFESEMESEIDRANLTTDGLDVPDGYELDYVESSHSAYAIVGSELYPLIVWYYFFKVFWKLKI